MKDEYQSHSANVRISWDVDMSVTTAVLLASGNLSMDLS